VFLAYATPFIAAVFLWAVLRYRFIPQEERTLSERFGEEYRAYRTRVDKWI
jgi:protein-S-isoprenylcysteine O-methyltransferase Ste14